MKVNYHNMGKNLLQKNRYWYFENTGSEKNIIPVPGSGTGTVIFDTFEKCVLLFLLQKIRHYTRKTNTGTGSCLRSKASTGTGTIKKRTRSTRLQIQLNVQLYRY